MFQQSDWLPSIAQHEVAWEGLEMSKQPPFKSCAGIVSATGVFDGDRHNTKVQCRLPVQLSNVELPYCIYTKTLENESKGHH